MDRKTALAAAAAVTMTVAGGVSALFLTVGSGAGAATIGTGIVGAEADQPEVTVEYIDQDGNPVADPTTVAVAPAAVSRSDGPGANTAYSEETDAAYGEEAEHEDEEAENEEDDYEDGDAVYEDENEEHDEGGEDVD